MKSKLKFFGLLLVSLSMIFASAPGPVLAAGEQLDLELWYMPVVRPYFPDAKSVAEIMQADLADVGIKTTLVTYDWGEYLDRLEDGNHDMALIGWSADIGDPDNFLHVLLHGSAAKIGTAQNNAFYVNDDVDALLTEARGSTNLTLRTANYEEAQEIIHKDSPWVTVAHSQNLAGVSSDVTGFKIHPTGAGANVFANVSVAGSTDLIIARGGDSVTFDPAELTDGQSWKVVRQVYDGLYNLPADSIDLAPALATGYTVSPDFLEWTFDLRQGVKFHDGSDFNSSAVVFSFERAANWENSTSPYYINGYIPPEAGYYDYIYGDLDLKVEEVSTYVVKFTLAQPFAPFLASLAMGVFSIVSPTYVMAHSGTDTADRLGQNPVGTGPYKFKSWEKGTTVTLEKNADYFGPAPKTDQLIFKNILEAATAVSELQAGTVHIIDTVGAADAKTIEEDASLTLPSQAGMNVGYLSLNALRWPFSNDTAMDDPDFTGEKTTAGTLARRAIHYAINRPKIIEEVYDGRALQAKNPLPPSFWGYNDDVVDYAFDQDKAKELLTLLGFSTDKVAGAGFETSVLIVTIFGTLAVWSVVRKNKRK
jgi:ABC-type transport system substrate-binding protein